MEEITTQQPDVLAPISTGLPEPPANEAFTPAQWEVLKSIMTAVIPSLSREANVINRVIDGTVSHEKYDEAVEHLRRTMVAAPNDKELEEYLLESPYDTGEFHDLLKRNLITWTRGPERRKFAFLLSALSTRAGSLFLTGSTTPFPQQPHAAREAIFNGWASSYLPDMKMVWKLMSTVAKNSWIKTSPSFYKITGFPKVPDHYKPGEHYKYEFLQFPLGTSPEVIETDIIIVGSGCGGGVCAKNLAEAGHQVLVVDKSYYFTPASLPMSEREGGVHLYENGGNLQSDDGSTVIIAGSNWGGGGTVNWSASLHTQGFVRKEWAEDRGLKFFNTAEFQTCLDRVCKQMGVSGDHVRHNHGNQVILEGARKLGYHAKVVPQNTGGHEHYCGHCTLGCGSAQKQGPSVAWLPDAGRAGAKFAEGFQVDKVLFEESKGTKKAVGVKGTWTSRDANGGVNGPLSKRTVREVIVKAKKVIISCGTIMSPIVLLRSGLKNSQIGRNLYLHPVNFTIGIFKEDVRPWEGGILTTVCTSFEDQDGHGHGAKIEATCMLPSWSISFMNGTGFDFKMMALKYRHMNAFISIVRDRDPGRVYPDPESGLPRVQYTPSDFDRAHGLEGVIAQCKMCYVTGAEEIHVSGVPPFIRNPVSTGPSNPNSEEEEEAEPGITDPRFCAWLKELRRVGNKPASTLFGCAHQMGSNRMSVRSQDGVVDPKGKVWGTEGLYVSDASVFPSASGVNPMVTNMAISDWISRGISRELKREANAIGVSAVL